MTDVPKIVPRIVYERLRAAQPEQAHPEADLLTAFAEQALSAAERDSVLEHMARCGECREAVTLTLPSAAGVAAPIADNAEEVASVSRMRAPRHTNRSLPGPRPGPGRICGGPRWRRVLRW